MQHRVNRAWQKQKKAKRQWRKHRRQNIAKHRHQRRGIAAAWQRRGNVMISSARADIAASWRRWRQHARSLAYIGEMARRVA